MWSCSVQFSLSLSGCARVDVPVDVIIVADCDQRLEYSNIIWDLVVYMASYFYPHPYPNGFRLWLVATSVLGNEGRPDIVFDPTMMDSGDERSILSYINGLLRQCNPSPISRASLASSMNYVNDVTSRTGRNFILGVITARTGEELNMDFGLRSSIEPFASRNLFPIIYYAAPGRPEPLDILAQEMIIYRPVYPPSENAFLAVSEEVCNLITTTGSPGGFNPEFGNPVIPVGPRTSESG